MRKLLILAALALPAANCAADGAEASGFCILTGQADKETDVYKKAALYDKALSVWKTGDGIAQKGFIAEKLAVCRLSVNENAKALEDIKSAIKANPKSATAHIVASYIYSALGDCASARRETKDSITALPDDQTAPLLYQNAMISLLCEKNRKQAIHDLTKALESAQKSKQPDLKRKILLRRAAVRCETGAYAKAFADIDKAAELKSEPPAYEHLLESAVCRQRKGEPDKAFRLMSDYIGALVMPPEEDGAAETSTDSLKLRPGINETDKRRLPEAFCRRAILQEAAHNSEAAVQDYTDAITIDIEAAAETRNPILEYEKKALFNIGSCYYNRARLYESESELIFAAQDYEEACKRKVSKACAKSQNRR